MIRISFCALALVFLNGCMTCTLAGCIPGVFLEALRIPSSEASALEQATVEVCHNSVCASGQLQQPGQSVQLDDPIHTSVEVWTMDDNGEYALMVSITAADHVMQDGDTYAVTLTASDGRELGRGSWRAIGHDTNYPNGERCGGGCKNPILEPMRSRSGTPLARTSAPPPAI